MKWLRCAIFALLILSFGKIVHAQQLAYFEQPVSSYPGQSVIAPDWPVIEASQAPESSVAFCSYDMPPDCCDGGCCPVDTTTPYGFGQVRPPRPARWVTGADALYLFRVGEQGQGIIYRQIDNAVMYSMSDFDFNGKFAYRVFAQYNLNRRWSVEGVFTRLQNDWNATGIASDNVQPDVEPIELRADGITIVSPTETFTLGYSTEFQTGELNAKYYLNDWSLNLLGGFRWVDVNEQFSSFITNTSTHFDYSTTNRMYGGQFGIESQHWLGYGVMRLDLGLKGGIYQNHSTFQTTPVGAISASDSGNGIAWLGEANIGLTMPIFRHGCLRAGYRAYHMTGLAIAADQLNAADLTVGTAQINQDGQALYHGVSLGFEYWF